MNTRYGAFSAFLAIIVLMTAAPVRAATLDWAGQTWTISTSRIGSGLVTGNTGTAFVDSSGYLHLDLSKIGGKWYGGEVATVNNLGFGSYYWVFNAPLTSMEAQDVLAGFSYGPQNGLGVSSQNEIDVEFSRWNNSSWFPAGNNGDFDIYPPPPAKKGSDVEHDWNYTGGNTATCRIDWSSTSITESIWSGVAPTNASTSTANVTWTLSDTATIPQSALPFMFNFWAFGTLPTQPVDAIVQTFQYIPAPAPAPPHQPVSP